MVAGGFGDRPRDSAREVVTIPHQSKQGHSLNLRAGDVVEVRSETEIWSTLDSQGTLEHLPFMPEMLKYCGKRFRVYKRADKTCDTIGKTGLRRMRDTVHLEGLRCDGEAHGGCQAGCLLFWKEAWLKKVPKKPAKNPGDGVAESPAESLPGASNQENSMAWTRLVKTTRIDDGSAAPGEETYRCQATELTKATSPMASWDPRQYCRDIWAGNVGLREFVRGILILLFNQIQGLRGGRTYPFDFQGTQIKTPSASLGLQPGELVQIRSINEIMQTLDARNKNRGLWFDAEMMDYCGKQFRVLRKVEKIISDRTGKMIKLPNDCLILEGVVCCARYKLQFCPRSIYPFWREIWLKRVE